MDVFLELGVYLILFIAVGIFAICCYVFYANNEDGKNDIKDTNKNVDHPNDPNEPIITPKEEMEAEEPKPAEAQAPTQEPVSEDELRAQIKRDVMEELRAGAKKVERKKLSTLKIVALVMFGLQLFGIAGLYTSAGLDFVSAIARGIGASVFLIVGAVLVIVDDLKGV